jgi:hypothetical protein
MSTLSGTFIPLPTAFTDDRQAISEIRLARIVRYWMQHGADGFFLNGETGEYLTVVTSERKSVLEMVHRDAQASLPLIVNISSLSTGISLDLGQHASRHGAVAAFIVPPYFGSYTPAEIQQHLRTVAMHSGLQIIIGDPRNQITPDVREVLSGMPQVRFAEATGVEEWSCEDARCSAAQTFGTLSEGRFGVKATDALARLGPASLYKALAERQGIELGGVRSPKQDIELNLIESLLDAAA